MKPATAFEGIAYVGSASGAVQDNSAFVDAVITRHADVQHGKFDRGRRKMPWLERINSRLQLTMTRSGGLNWEAPAFGSCLKP